MTRLPKNHAPENHVSSNDGTGNLTGNLPGNTVPGNNVPGALHAIQEFFVTQDRYRAERADALCDHFLDALARLVEQLGQQADDKAMLAELWPLMELRDAMTLATREVLNIDGEATIALAKHKRVRANPYARSLTLVKVEGLENATRQVDRLAARMERPQ